MTYGSQLRALLDREETLCCPGVHDSLTARAVDRVGVEAIYMTGYGTSLSRVGVPDAGLITMPEMVENAKRIQEAVDVPVIADADNGYGNATNVIRTVREFIKTGIAGIHIEDQTFPKRCGHVKGREVIPKEEAVGKYRAAADVRDERDEDFVIIARTDARGAVGGSMADAIDRANAYCEAGADVAFVEGPIDEAEMEAACEGVSAPMLYNYAGISPKVAADRLASMGYDMVIYPAFSNKATIQHTYENTRKFVENPGAAMDEITDRFEELPFDLHEFSGFPEVVEWERKYLPEDDAEKYENTQGADIGDGE